MEAGIGVVVMDRKAEVVDLARLEIEIARGSGTQRPLHLDRPDAGLEPALCLDRRAACHVTLVEDVAVLDFAVGIPAQQIHELAIGEFGLDRSSILELVPAAQRLAATTFLFDLGARRGDVLGHALAHVERQTRSGRILGVTGHGAQVFVTGAPATGLVRILDLVGREHHGELDLVGGVHLAAIDERYRYVLGAFPLEAQVQVIGVVRGLHRDRDSGALAGDRRGLGLLARDHLLAHVGGFLVVAGRAAVAGLERTGTTVILADQGPFHRGLARIEQGDAAFGGGCPVDTEAVRGGLSGCCHRCGGAWGRLRASLCERSGDGGIDALLFGDFCRLAALTFFLRLFLCHEFGRGFGIGGALQAGDERLRHCVLVRFDWSAQLFEFLVRKVLVYLLVCDALVAVDTGVAVFHRELVLVACSRLLPLGIHRVPVVAVATFARIGALHRVPHTPRHRQAVFVEFLRRVHGAHQLVIDLVAGLDLAHDFVHPGARYMAIRTRGLDATAVAVVHRADVFGVDVFLHLVTRDTEGFGVGDLHAPVESAPKHHADDHEQHGGAQG